MSKQTTLDGKNLCMVHLMPLLKKRIVRYAWLTLTLFGKQSFIAGMLGRKKWQECVSCTLNGKLQSVMSLVLVLCTTSLVRNGNTCTHSSQSSWTDRVFWSWSVFCVVFVHWTWSSGIISSVFLGETSSYWILHSNMFYTCSVGLRSGPDAGHCIWT